MSESFEQEPQRKKSGVKTLLIVLGILGGVTVLACGGCIVGSILLFRNAISDDPATVRTTAQEISEVEVPDGFDPMFSMSMMGMKMATFGGGGASRLLMLMSFPAAMAGNEEQMRQQMEQSLQQQTGRQNLSELESDTRTYEIRGEEHEVRIAKVEDDEGHQLRQVTGVFTAKNGSPAMLMMMLPEDEWNDGGEAALEALLASMK